METFNSGFEQAIDLVRAGKLEKRAKNLRGTSRRTDGWKRRGI
jgi:hypothetical protein